MKILKFLFEVSQGVSQGVIMGSGLGFTAILAFLSLAVKNGVITEAKVDLSTLTSGYWVYVWTISLLVFSAGRLARSTREIWSQRKRSN